MNKVENNISLRSEEVQEIMGEVPAKIVRWGTSIIFIVIIILIAGSYFFKYPEVINSDIKITIENSEISNNICISSFDAGKIKAGQKVLIRLYSFPESEFGFLEGEVKNISFKYLENGKYIATIYFPKNLKTNIGYNLPTVGTFEGEAAFITKDIRLIERIIRTVNNPKK